MRLGPREGDPGDWPHRLDVDGVEGAETQGGAGDRMSSEVNHLERGEGVVTREGPYLARQLSGFCHRRQVNLYGRGVACRIRMAWHERHRGYTGSGRRGPTSSLKRGVLMPGVWNGGYKLVRRGFRSPNPCVVFVILVAGVCVRVSVVVFVSLFSSPYSPFIVARGVR